MTSIAATLAAFMVLRAILDAASGEAFLRSLVAALFLLRWARHANSLGIAPVEQLAGDEGALDGLAHAHVIRNEQAHRVKADGHDERHELMGPRPHRRPTE